MSRKADLEESVVNLEGGVWTFCREHGKFSKVNVGGEIDGGGWWN